MECLLRPDRADADAISPGRIEDSTDRRRKEEAGEPVDYSGGNIPLADGQPGAAEQVADLIAFLVSDRAAHITGTPVWTYGGQSLLLG